jgi:hypothetical protein
MCATGTNALEGRELLTATADGLAAFWATNIPRIAFLSFRTVFGDTIGYNGNRETWFSIR